MQYEHRPLTAIIVQEQYITKEHDMKVIMMNKKCRFQLSCPLLLEGTTVYVLEDCMYKADRIFPKLR